MVKVLISLLVGTVLAFGQYSVEPAGAPPADLAAEMTATLAGEGHKIVSGDGSVWAELWFRKDSADGPDTGEIDVSWSTVAHGTLIGVIRFPGKGEGRRGQAVEPGVYTMRFSFYPVDGAHQGIEPSRDFVILSPAGIDTDPATTPGFDELMDMSRKASGTPHPVSLACWKAEGDWQEGVSQLEHDWVLGVKIGDTELMLIVKGVNAHG